MSQSLADFVRTFAGSTGPALIVAGSTPLKALAEQVCRLLEQSKNSAFLLDPESLSPQELEAFLYKRLREEGTVVALLDTRAPQSFAGFLNHFLKDNRLEFQAASGWESVIPHRQFKLLIISSDQGLELFSSLVKKNDFRYRYYYS